MRKPRHLSPEDRAIWDTVAKRVEPLHPTLTEPKVEPAPTPKAAPAPKEQAPFFEVGSKADTHRPDRILPGIGHALRAAPVQMDSKAFGKMSRGKIKPEARIDLHGMTLDEAHPALLSFILGAQDDGKRLVLVITGKGKIRHDDSIMSGRKGVLRHHVPQWLRLPPLAAKILEIRPAHIRHGGDGAYYVYLRKARN